MILPRKDEEGNYYISYSQVTSWKKSPRSYMREYFFGEDDTKAFLKPYGEFGTKLGESLEHNDFSGWTDKEVEFLKTIPRFDEFERGIKLQMSGYYIKGYIDTNTLAYKEEDGIKKELVKVIADYKTGEIEKRISDYESDNYIQIHIYAAGVEAQTGSLPEEAYVYLVQRDGNAFAKEELTLGDRFVTIPKVINRDIVDKAVSECDRVAKEISKHYQVYLKLNEVLL